MGFWSIGNKVLSYSWAITSKGSSTVIETCMRTAKKIQYQTNSYTFIQTKIWFSQIFQKAKIKISASIATHLIWLMSKFPKWNWVLWKISSTQKNLQTTRIIWSRLSIVHQTRTWLIMVCKLNSMTTHVAKMKTLQMISNNKLWTNLPLASRMLLKLLPLTLRNRNRTRIRRNGN